MKTSVSRRFFILSDITDMRSSFGFKASRTISWTYTDSPGFFFLSGGYWDIYRSGSSPVRRLSYGCAQGRKHLPFRRSGLFRRLQGLQNRECPVVWCLCLFLRIDSPCLAKSMHYAVIVSVIRLAGFKSHLSLKYSACRLSLCDHLEYGISVIFQKSLQVPAGEPRCDSRQGWCRLQIP